MPFAGDQEVVIAIQAQLDGRAGLARGQRRPHRQMAGLRFLAAETAAHAAAFDAHAMAGQAQRMRHPVLHLAGVLRAAVDQPLILLLRQRQRDLAFQIEMLLPANGELALQPMRRGGQRSGGVAAPHRDGGQHEALRRHRLFDGQHRRQRRDVELDLARRMARRLHGVGDDQADHLAGVLHGVAGEHRFVLDEGGQHRVTGNVGGQHDGAHAGARQRRRGIDAEQPAMRDGREDRRGMQRAARLGQVVHIGRQPLHLGARAFVRG